MSGSDLPQAQPGENEPRFLGLKLHAVNMSQVSSRILCAVEERERFTVTYVNPYIAVVAEKSRDLTAALNEFDLVLADGIGLVVGARILGIPVPERLGTDYVCPELFRKCAEEELPLRVFLLGSRPGIAEKAARNLRAAFAPVSVVGTYHGWFNAQEDRQVVEMVNASQADMLLVGMGTPRQQRWVSAHAAALQCPVIMTGGAYLDHLAESLTYYPEWVDRARLNWLYRLCTEPRYVWRRYTVEAAVFFRLLLRQFMRGGAPEAQ